MDIENIREVFDRKFRKIGIVSASITLFSFIISIYIICLEINKYYFIKKQYKFDAEREFNVISKTLEYTFEYTNYINSNIGHQIALHGADDFAFIHKLLSNPSHNHYNDMLYFSWSLFDWVDNQNLQRVNSQVGIRNPASNMSSREYTQLSPKHPWTLQFAKPTIGNPSKKFVIPAGTGITNSDGKYLGVIVVGFSVDDLIKQIQQFTNNPKLGFILEGIDGTQYLKYGNNTEYLINNKLGNYPFTLKVGFKKWSMQKEFLTNLCHDILKMTFGMILLGGLLIIFSKILKKKTIQNDKRRDSLIAHNISSKEETDFTKTQINEMVAQINASMMQKEKEENITDAEKQEMYSVMMTLKMLYNKLFSPSTLYLKPARLQDIVKSILKLYANEIQIAELKVETVFNFDEQITLDEIRMRKVLGFIILYISDVILDDKNLKITITKIDNLIKILFTYKHSLMSNIENYIVDSEINYDYIEGVVHAHKGEIIFKKDEILLTISSAME